MKKPVVYLFTSPTCPHCPAAKDFIHKFIEQRDDFELIELSFATEEGRKKAKEFNVVSVPTFIIKGPEYSDNIGLKGNQTAETMNKYLDLSLGIKREKKGFFADIFSKK